MVGPEGLDGEESFDVLVCTPAWLEDELQRQPGLHGRHHFIVNDFDPHAVEDQLREEIESLEAPDWPALAEKIGRIGRWEFEDYQPGAYPVDSVSGQAARRVSWR